MNINKNSNTYISLTKIYSSTVKLQILMRLNKNYFHHELRRYITSLHLYSLYMCSTPLFVPSAQKKQQHQEQERNVEKLIFAVNDTMIRLVFPRLTFVSHPRAILRNHYEFYFDQLHTDIHILTYIHIYIFTNTKPGNDALYIHLYSI